MTLMNRSSTFAVISAAVGLSLAGVATSAWAETHRDIGRTALILGSLVVVAFTLVGAVVAAARPANYVGWLMLSGGCMWSSATRRSTWPFLGS